ncbi:MAG TPA: M12 family metallo-peptidase [Hyphomicrobiaceae bacterium]|nr:M12 family metallo-peptidase [Hyphomicrobiaceae bacterium]
MRRLAVVFGTGLLLVALVGPAAAQTKPAAGTAESEQVIITAPAGQESKVRGLLSRLKGKIEKRRLETTGSDVWSLPKARAEAMKKRLERMGAKVTRLKENWQHILERRKKADVSLTPAQQAVIDKATSQPETVNLGIVRMPDAAVAEHALTRQVEPPGPKGAAGPAQDRFAKVVLPLGETGDVTLVRTRPVVKSARGLTWSGEVEETGERAVLMLWQDGHLTGQFGYKGRIYLVSHMGGDIHTMVEVDPRKMPPDHAPGSEGKSMGAPRDTPAQPVTPRPLPPEPAVAPFPDAERQALEAKAITIDVMLLYTPAAARHYIREPSDLLTLAIEQANDTFRNSGLGNISLRLVHYQEVAYEEGNSDHFDHLYRMVDGEGPFKELKKLRNEKRADVVGLIIDSPTGCGQATRVGAEAEEAFFVVHHTCAAITYSIAHEIGHIIGARHDRAVDPNDAPFAFAHGYVNGSKWRDMMSYREGCGDCPRIPFWSNPRIMYKGEPTGTAAADNARVILEQAERVAKFR